MSNYVSILIAVLEKAGLFTAEEAEALAKELNSSTLPDNYAATSILLDDLYKKLSIKGLEDKIDTSSLEAKATAASLEVKELVQTEVGRIDSEIEQIADQIKSKVSGSAKAVDATK